ncbi:DUF1376 domain-containing protein [Paroceanicella profunda]|uniref:DUF1376 domain-containing protein n=1 Tax=Paroceanicella profunda TaxID=2579971 RepID=A0A5B8G1V8_9RHOB|nr:DUF1376 domain-containing protein [Paroceanicella profunda]QDL92533.1 DUF1376 domain-containing protein [Paroceanicella profunda]
MSDLPLYPVPSGSRIRGDWVPLHFRRLLNSRFVAQVDPAAGFFAVILWAVACDQDPAGTLPEDDVQLARLAGFGRDLDGWRRVRQGALYGWTPCACEIDGEMVRRLQHRTVTEMVGDAIAKLARRQKVNEEGAERAMLSRLRDRMQKAGATARMTEREDLVIETRRILGLQQCRWTIENVRAAMSEAEMKFENDRRVADLNIRRMPSGG